MRGHDANGNYFAQNGWEYDIENRLTKAVGGNSADQFYGYDAGNKRVWKRYLYNVSTTVEQVFFYGAGGRLGTYDIQWELISGSYQMRLVMREQNFYYGGRLLRSRTDFSGSGDPGDQIAGSALIAHEALHKFGLLDPQIQQKLGITVGAAPVNISEKLTKDCFPGTPGILPP